jgi:hypothetical protein
MKQLRSQFPHQPITYRIVKMKIIYPFAFGLFLSPLVALAADATGTFTAKAGAAPWSDRVSVWQLATVPPSLDATAILPQGDCSSRSLTVPTGAKSILIGVSENDVTKFLADYPDAKPTGESASVSHPDGTGSLSYTIFKMVNPPATIQAKDATQAYGAGLILLQIGDKPAPPTAPSAGK